MAAVRVTLNFCGWLRSHAHTVTANVTITVTLEVSFTVTFYRRRLRSRIRLHGCTLYGNKWGDTTPAVVNATATDVVAAAVYGFVYGYSSAAKASATVAV